ncbi:hypothetical protein D9756_002635 [Leucocoprinus leucothites]|uniref:DUF6534 domain-containing protein n=1 Tax=Leucocoprinus leucothites TaxID=201217 RepID=A0A8H5LLV5_9AGAR|nr:hypothetical protein D9756_002635 [Leucoagaricus leucothites]
MPAHDRTIYPYTGCHLLGHFPPSPMAPPHFRAINISTTYGPLLIGALFTAFFHGVLTIQVYQYYQDFPEDPQATKVFVAVVWILNLIDLTMIVYFVYYHLITTWGDLRGVFRMISPRGIHMFLIGLLTMFAQLFLLYRVWIFSERNLWIVGPVAVCSLGTFGLFSVTSIFYLLGWRFPLGMKLMMTVGTFTDILIALLLCYYVRKRSKETRHMKVTGTLVAQIIRYTVATSALTSLLTVACLIAFTIDPQTFVYIGLQFSSGVTYANAVLMNLNARRRFRKALNGIEPSFAKSIELGGIPSPIQRPPGFSTASSSTAFKPDTSNCRLASVMTESRKVFDESLEHFNASHRISSDRTSAGFATAVRNPGYLEFNWISKRSCVGLKFILPPRRPKILKIDVKIMTTHFIPVHTGQLIMPSINKAAENVVRPITPKDHQVIVLSVNSKEMATGEVQVNCNRRDDSLLKYSAANQVGCHQGVNFERRPPLALAAYPGTVSGWILLMCKSRSVTIFKHKADILIAILLCYYVRKRSKETRHMRVTGTLVAQIIRYTVATSAFTSLLTVACLIGFIINPRTFVYMGLQFSSGVTYANAVLMNLNARRKFRKTLDDIEPSFGKSVELGGMSSAIQRPPGLSGSTQDSHSCNTSGFTPRLVGSGIKTMPPFAHIRLNTYRPRSRSQP